MTSPRSPNSRLTLPCARYKNFRTTVVRCGVKSDAHPVDFHPLFDDLVIQYFAPVLKVVYQAPQREVGPVDGLERRGLGGVPSQNASMKKTEDAVVLSFHLTFARYHCSLCALCARGQRGNSRIERCAWITTLDSKARNLRRQARQVDVSVGCRTADVSTVAGGGDRTKGRTTLYKGYQMQVH